MPNVDPLDPFLPAVQAWFRESFSEPTPPQTMGWPVVRDGKSALIVAPTGSGKTLTAFLWGLNDLWSRALDGEDFSGIQILYISPLRALGNDIHRNLELPLEGVLREAERLGAPLPELRRAVRSGDTPPKERQGIARRPPHILITTPESLYLMLTSKQMRPALTSVRTVIVDEVHALMESKRGVHLALSLERLEALTERPLQRVGLSATVRPLEEAARFLGGQDESGSDGSLTPRPVEIVDAGARKEMDLAVLSPVDDFRDLPGDSVWPSLTRKVLDLVTQHRSTLVFVNDRAQAEKVTGLLNELAREELAQSHHGSLSRERRLEVEEALKRGDLPALVATSSLELGIDVGAIDLVVQISSPTSTTRGLQRVGRAGHLLTHTSVGRILPKHRRDVLESAVVAREMLYREVEPLRVPRNCLDVLAQQVVAMVAVESWQVEDLYTLARRAYPYRDLSLTQLESILGMLSGAFPAREFSGLRARVSHDQAEGTVEALSNTATLAVTNGGTIPERGYYPVILAGEGVRLGELDEEFVFESAIGDVFLLGSATWRIVDIRTNQVFVTPAPGAPARMPFWHGEGLGRPYELGRRIGSFTRELHKRIDDPDCLEWLQEECALDETAALNLRTYLLDQLEATDALPTDKTLLLESFRDELGDLRLLLHSPFGRRIHGPWSLALAARMRFVLGVTVSVAYNDDGILFRLPQADAPPPLETFLSVTSRTVRDLVVQELAGSALFAAAFREAAERSLVLTKALPGRRTPLWLQRIRASDLMELAREYPSFPVMAEAYRECLEDYFDLPHLIQMLSALEKGDLRIAYVETPYPSPFAAGHLYDFVAAYLYEGDAPRAERYSQLLSLNRELLRDVLDEGGLRELLQPEAIEEIEALLQRRARSWRARTPDELLTLLLHLGDLSTSELEERVDGDIDAMLAALTRRNDVVQVSIPTPNGPTMRWVASEEISLYRVALADEEADDDLAAYREAMTLNGPISMDEALAFRGASPPSSKEEACDLLVRRCARVNVPFQIHHIVERYGMDAGTIARSLARLEAEGRIALGDYTPERSGPEWCDVEVLGRIHRRTLSILRKEAEPVDAVAYASFLREWQGLDTAVSPSGEASPDALRQVLKQLQGFPLQAELLEQEVLPARMPGYRPEHLDRLISLGEVAWVGQGGAGPRGRKIAFYLREDMPALLPASAQEPTTEAQRRVHRALAERGALFFTDLEVAAELSSTELVRALWEMAWEGLVTNDSFAPVRAFRSPPKKQEAAQISPPASRRRPSRWLRREVSERVASAESAASGRWSLVSRFDTSEEEAHDAWASLVLERYGIVTHETLGNETLAPPWSALAEEWRRMEAMGRIRRGYYLSGLFGVQFAAPDAVDALRRHVRQSDSPVASHSGAPRLVSLLDPACAYGAVYPVSGPSGRRLTVPRLPNNFLVLWGGEPVLAVESMGRVLTPLTTLGADELRQAIGTLSRLVLRGSDSARRRPRLLIERWGEEPVGRSSVAGLLEEMGYQREPNGFVLWGYQAEKQGEGTP